MILAPCLPPLLGLTKTSNGQPGGREAATKAAGGGRTFVGVMGMDWEVVMHRPGEGQIWKSEKLIG